MRICGADDERALQRLAGLDSARSLDGTILAAESQGEPLAAISLENGRVVADPFSHTAELVDLLRARAADLKSVNDPHVMPDSRRLHRAWAWLGGLAQGTNP